MTVKIIAENIIKDSHFISATEQAGGYVSQPLANTANVGAFRPIATGDIADFTYSGAMTSDGNVGGTTSICANLNVYGDDYFIGGTLAITSGACSGESKTLTDFAQSTGTFTHAAFTAKILSGVTFMLTVSAATRSFIATLIASGDAGAATFKWSHNAGANYLGRNNPNAANWLGITTIPTASVDGSENWNHIIQDKNGRWLAIFADDDPKVGTVQFSTTNGITWGGEVKIVDTAGSDASARCVKLLRNGRILFSSSNGIFYSDDNGTTWVHLSYSGTTIEDFIELSNGLIAGVYSSTNNVYFITSNDGGFTWSSPVTVAADTNSQRNPAIVECDNGTIMVSYDSDEDAVNDFEIKCKISSNGGATWGTVIAVINLPAPGGNDITYSKLLKDINGDIYCFASEYAASDIVYSLSTTNGITWGAKTVVYNGAASEVYPSPCLIDGNQIICAFVLGQALGVAFKFVRRGIWETYSANAPPVAKNGVEQKLICNVGLKWYGGAGVAGDSWTMATIGYDYSMKNLIQSSPSKSYRSLTDNAVQTITLDAGANARFDCTGVGFFGCNVRTLNFQMNATDSWGGGGPSVNEAIDFLLASGTIDAVSGNYIQDTSLMAGYKNHQLSKKGKAERYFFRATSGAESGNTWEILDNVGDYIVLDTEASTALAGSDTFVIFQSSISKTFTGGIYRFIRISIDAQQTADNYYELGSMIAGLAISLTKDWGVGYGLDYVYDVDLMETVAGGTIAIKGADRKRYFDLGWKANQTTRDEVISVMDYIEGKNLCLIPDGSVLTTCYLVQKDGNINSTHRSLSKFDFAVKLREVI